MEGGEDIPIVRKKKMLRIQQSTVQQHNFVEQRVARKYKIELLRIQTIKLSETRP